MGSRVPILCVIAAMVVACGVAPMAADANGSNAPYEIVLEQRVSALLRLDCKGAGRDLDTGKSIDVSEADMRRKSCGSVNFGAKDPMLWRSNLLRRLKSGELTLGDLHVEPVEHGGAITQIGVGASLCPGHSKTRTTPDFIVRQRS